MRDELNERSESAIVQAKQEETLLGNVGTTGINVVTLRCNREKNPAGGGGKEGE